MMDNQSLDYRVSLVWVFFLGYLFGLFIGMYYVASPPSAKRQRVMVVYVNNQKKREGSEPSPVVDAETAD